MHVDDGQNTDESLMVLVQQGDHKAFSALVRRHADRFYATAYRFCGHTENAEDIVQNAFIKLWHNADQWDPDRGARFTTWFTRIVINAAHDHNRRAKRHAGATLFDEALHSLGIRAAAQDVVMEQKDEAQRIEQAIQALPTRQKEALNLCFYEDFSNKEAAACMEVSIKALESLLMRAKTTLKAKLRER